MEKCPKCSRMVDGLVDTKDFIWSGTKICYSCDLKTQKIKLNQHQPIYEYPKNISKEKNKMFEPMIDIPKNEEEVKIALRYGKDGSIAETLIRIFEIYTLQGNTLLDAYENTLLAHIGEPRKYPAIK